MGQGLINQLKFQWLCHLACDVSFKPKIQISFSQTLNFVENNNNNNNNINNIY